MGLIKHVATVLMSVTLVGAAQADIYSECVSAFSSGNNTTGHKLAATIQKLNIIPVYRADDANKCVTLSRGVAMVFDSGINGFREANEKDAAYDAKNQGRAEKLAKQYETAKIEAEAACLEERRQIFNQFKYDIHASAQQMSIANANREIELACFEQYKSEPNRTLLNPVCADIFRKNGLPNGDDLSEAQLERVQKISEAIGVIDSRLLELSRLLSPAPNGRQLSEPDKYINLLGSPLEECGTQD